MTATLFLEAIMKFFTGAIFTALLLFIPAGTIHWFNGWLFMLILFVPMFFAGIVMMVKSPDLLKTRLHGKENEKEQKAVIFCSGIMFMTGFILCGLGHRFSWYELSRPATIVAAVVFVMSYALYAEVLRENRWLSRIVEVQEGQEVVSTGMYGIVRHPMYAVTLVMFLSMPLVLGSVYAFIIFLSYPVFITRRIRNEEEVLRKNLKGYDEYMKKVRYRLIPFIW